MVVASGGASAPIRVYVHLQRSLDVAAYRAGHASGREPDVTPYGFHHAEALGFDIRYPAPDAPSPTRVQRALNGRLGFDVAHAWRNRRAIAAADVIWTMLENEALAVAFLMWLRLVPRRPIVGSTVWMIDQWQRLSDRRRRLYRRLVGLWSILLVHSERCTDVARRCFPRVKVQLLHFGVSAETFLNEAGSASPARPIVLLGIGNDRTRDWQTMLDAFGNDDRFRLVLMCRWIDDETAARYDNVELRRVSTMAEMLDGYRRASYAVVPMVDNIYSGITVALEAAALGIPVLSSATGGVSTYFTPGEVLFVPVGDPAAMRAAVLAQSDADRAAQARRARDRFRHDDYSTLGMMRRYAAVTHDLRAARNERRNDRHA